MMKHKITVLSLLLFVTILAACVTPAPSKVVSAPSAPMPTEKTVVILVVDEFPESQPSNGSAKTSPSDSTSICIDLYGEGYFSRGTRIRNDHGSSVLNTITMTLESVYSATLASDQTSDEGLWSVPEYGLVKVMPVDIKEFNTASVTKSISETLANESKPNVAGFVINMSWVIGANNNCELKLHDPLVDLLCSFRPGSTACPSTSITPPVISVAAAGHHREGDKLDSPSEPSKPALLDNVISVSFSGTNLGDKNELGENEPTPLQAKSGEIVMDGHIDENKGQYTSYAAPRFSVWAAMYLLAGGENPCPDEPGIYPVLGYKDDNFNWADASPTDKNLSLEDAVSRYCPSAAPKP